MCIARVYFFLVAFPTLWGPLQCRSFLILQLELFILRSVFADDGSIQTSPFDSTKNVHASMGNGCPIIRSLKYPEPDSSSAEPVSSQQRKYSRDIVESESDAEHKSAGVPENATESVY